MVKEGPTALNARNFISEITLYCTEYFDIEIKHKLKIKKDTICTLKYIPFFEMIFEVFSFIIRSAQFCENSININSYIEQTNLVIEICTTPSEGKPIAWEEHPQYPLMSLYTVFLLARENNYMLDITHKGGMSCFRLFPIKR